MSTTSLSRTSGSSARAADARVRPRGWWKKAGDARRRVPRPVWIVLAVIVGLYLLVVLASNVLLRTGLLRGWLNAEPDKLHVSYDSAWSPYPGRVIVSDFTLRFQDDNVQMLLDLEHIDMSVDLLALTKHVFRVRHLDGRGTSLRMRHKLADARGQEGRLAAYPPITGFPDPAVRKPQHKPEVPDDEYKLWTIELEEVATSIRELWIMEYRYRGEGSLAGGMRLKPLREFWLPPSVLLTNDGVLSIGDQEILVGQQSRVEAQVDAYDVRVPVGTSVLRQITARAEMRGEVSSLAPFASTYLRNLGVGLDGGRGRLSVKGRIDHGLVHPESRIEWSTNDVTVRLPGGLAVKSDLAFVGHVDAGRGGPAAALVDPDARPALLADLAIGKAQVWSGKEKDALVSLDDVRTAIRSGNADLTAPFPLSAVKLDIAALRLPDLHRLFELVAPPGVDVKKGAAAGSVHASYRGSALDARADIVVDGVHVVTDKVDVATAHGKTWFVASSKDVRSGIAIGGSGVALDDVGIRVLGSRVGGLGVAIDVTDGLVRTTGKSAVDVALTSRIVPGDRVLQLGASLASLPKALGEAPAGPDARASMRIHGDDAGLDVRLLEARDGDLTMRGRFRKPKQRDGGGAFLVEVGVLRAGVEIAGGETHVRPFASKEWLDEHTR